MNSGRGKRPRQQRVNVSFILKIMGKETIIIKNKNGLVYKQNIAFMSHEERVRKIFESTLYPVPDSCVGREYEPYGVLFPAFERMEKGESFWIAETGQETGSLGDRTGYLTKFSAMESGDSASIMDNEDLRKFEESYSVKWIQIENKGPICFQSQPIKPF